MPRNATNKHICSCTQVGQISRQTDSVCSYQRHSCHQEDITATHDLRSHVTVLSG